MVGTDAPVDTRNLERLAARAMFGLARTGAAGSNGSGNYIIALSTANVIEGGCPQTLTQLGNGDMSPLFLAVIEATEEAIYNSLLQAVSLDGRGGSQLEALPLDRLLEVGAKYNRLYSPSVRP